MAVEARSFAKLVKETITENHAAISFNGVAEGAVRPNVTVKTDETIATETLTITLAP